MKRSIFSTTLVFVSLLLFNACNSDSKKETNKETTADTTSTTRSTDAEEVHGTEVKPGDVELTHPLNQEWVSFGQKVYNLKCQSCHKLTEEKLVGPGWKNVTKRREPHWIMNMVTNVEMMLESDPEAQKLLEQCLVRMPNQNLSQEDARKVIEFMRSNDGEK
jgi:cytochrome c2